MYLKKDKPSAGLISENTSVFLNIVRFVSAELVVVGHATGLIAGTLDPQTRSLLPFPSLVFLAQFGVLVFFILSGFLICNSVLSKISKPGYGFKTYFIDRFARIYSGVVPCLIVILLVNLIRMDVAGGYGNYASLNIQAFAGNLLMLQEISFTNLAHFAGLNLPLNMKIPAFADAIPLWTLSIEWWIYLAFGWMVLGRKTAGKDPSLRFFVLMFFFLLIPIAVLASDNAPLLVAWIMGAAITLAFTRLSSIRRRVKVVKKSALLLAFAVLVVFAGLRVGQDVASKMVLTSDLLLAVLVAFAFAIAIALVKLSFNGRAIAGARAIRSAKFLAGCSYTLYLLHVSILNLSVSLNLPFSIILLVGVGFVSANIISVAVAYYTEMRHGDLARKLKKMWPGGNELTSKRA